MTPYIRGLNQVATYWSPGKADGFGGQKDYGAPVAIAVRWQGKAVLFKDATGQEVVSSAVVYVDRDLAIRGKLLLGTSEAAQPPEGTRQILQKGSSPSLDATRELHKVYI